MSKLFGEHVLGDALVSRYSSVEYNEQAMFDTILVISKYTTYDIIFFIINAIFHSGHNKVWDLLTANSIKLGNPTNIIVSMCLDIAYGNNINISRYHGAKIHKFMLQIAEKYNNKNTIAKLNTVILDDTDD